MRRSSGFTLVELLVVIAIIGVLVALLLPAVQAAREAARASQCKNNLKQVGLGLQTYHDAMGQFPAGWMGDQPEGTPGWGWSAAVLPYLEQQSLYDNVIRHALPVSDPANQQARETVIKTFVCPSDPRPTTFSIGTGGYTQTLDDGSKLFNVAKTNYPGVFGTAEIEDNPALGDGIFFFKSRTRIAEITDGLSNTFIVGERHGKLGGSVWTGVIGGANEAMARIVGVADHPPNDPHQHFEDFSSAHPSGVQFLMADGSVHRISNSITETVYRALCTRQGGEVAQLP